jgi:hypothetical protein
VSASTALMVSSLFFFVLFVWFFLFLFLLCFFSHIFFGFFFFFFPGICLAILDTSYFWLSSPSSLASSRSSFYFSSSFSFVR